MLSMLKQFFGSKKPEIACISSAVIPIYEKDAMPNLAGFEEMSGYAIDAYPYQRDQRGTKHFGSGDFSGDARELAVRTVARCFGIPTTQEALNQFEICIVPGFGFHGKIMAKRKKVN